MPIKKWPYLLKTLGAYIFLTLGVTIDNKVSFYTIKENGDDPVDSETFLLIDTDDRNFFVPLIFWFSYNQAPHDLKFLLKTKNFALRQVRVDEIEINAVGVDKEFLIGKRCSLSSSDNAYYDFSGYSPGMIAQTEISELIQENDEARVSIVYTVEYENQDSRSFESRWIIRAKRNIDFSTMLFHLIRGIGASGAA